MDCASGSCCALESRRGDARRGPCTGCGRCRPGCAPSRTCRTCRCRCRTCASELVSVGPSCPALELEEGADALVRRAKHERRLLVPVKDAPRAHRAVELVGVVQRVVVVRLGKRADLLVRERDAVVGVGGPDDVPEAHKGPRSQCEGQEDGGEGRTGDALVARDGLAARKVEPVGDGAVVLVALLDVAVSGGEMGREEAEGRVAVVEADGDGALCEREDEVRAARALQSRSTKTHCCPQVLARRSAGKAHRQYVLARVRARQKGRGSAPSWSPPRRS